ncbi:LysM peptidoglycan-binding domain-containing protein [Micrococcus luteus]
MTVTAPTDRPTAPRGGEEIRARPADLITAVACTAVGPAFLALAAQLSTAPPAVTDTARLERVLASGCAGIGLVLCAAWALALVTTGLWVIATRRSSPHADLLARLSPALLRRLAAGAFGLHLLLSPTAAAAGQPTAAWVPGAPDAAQSVADSTPRAHWLPVAPAPTGPGTGAPRRPDASAPTVTVVDGDCLWDLAAAELGPDATVLEVDARWREWHRHNRGVIGEDPHLLYSGTVLEIPPHSGLLPPEEATG